MVSQKPDGTQFGPLFQAQHFSLPSLSFICYFSLLDEEQALNLEDPPRAPWWKVGNECWCIALGKFWEIPLDFSISGVLGGGLSLHVNLGKGAEYSPDQNYGNRPRSSHICFFCGFCPVYFLYALWGSHSQRQSNFTTTKMGLCNAVNIWELFCNENHQKKDQQMSILTDSEVLSCRKQSSENLHHN